MFLDSIVSTDDLTSKPNLDSRILNCRSEQKHLIGIFRGNAIDHAAGWVVGKKIGRIFALFEQTLKFIMARQGYFSS